MNIIDIGIICFINLLSFVIGAKVGQNTSKGKDINLNPITIVKDNMNEKKEKKKESLKKRQIDTILQNIDEYDGTGLGQRDIPRE